MILSWKTSLRVKVKHGPLKNFAFFSLKFSLIYIILMNIYKTLSTVSTTYFPHIEGISDHVFKHTVFFGKKSPFDLTSTVKQYFLTSAKLTMTRQVSSLIH